MVGTIEEMTNKSLTHASFQVTCMALFCFGQACCDANIQVVSIIWGVYT